jgi:hypothetical protein
VIVTVAAGSGSPVESTTVTEIPPVWADTTETAEATKNATTAKRTNLMTPLLRKLDTWPLNAPAVVAAVPLIIKALIHHLFWVGESI